MLRIEMLKKGRNIGALVGGVAYLVFGLLPAFYVSSHATLLLLSRLLGGPVESELLLRILTIAGTLFGLFLSGSLFIVLGAVSGTLIAYSLYHVQEFLRTLRGEVAEEKPPLIINRRANRLSEEIKRELDNELAFLKPHLQGIHGIVVIGSAAYNLNESTSDIDIVIITRADSFDRIRDVVFEHEIDISLKAEGMKKEFIVLGPEYTEELFRLSSPFSFSIRYSRVLWDDGYLAGIMKRYQASPPMPAYYFKTFYEYIAVQYYGSLTKLERDVKEKGCSISCCDDRKDCEGHKSAEMFLKVILRMLYITLPAHGYIPLTKRDLVSYVERIYGRDWADTIEEIINLSRLSHQTIYYDQYLRFKPVATALFRETLEILGRKAEVIRVLRDAANMVRGNYNKIQDRAFKECVL